MRRLSIAFAFLALSATSARADVRVCAGNEIAYTRLLMGAAVVCLYLVVRYAVAHFERVRESRSALAVPISLLVAERVARAVQRRAGMIATIGLVGVPSLVVMHIASLAILSTIIGCIGLRGYFIARSMLQLIERGQPREGGEHRSPLASLEAAGPRAMPTTAAVLGRTVTVHSADDEVSLDVSARTLAAARRHAVPTSIAKRR